MAEPGSGVGAADPLIGLRLDGRYEVASLLARGGMSRVYRAVQHPLGRVVAVKVLAIGGNPDQELEFKSRFLLEASVSARLTHPNTVRVFDHGEAEGGLLYIVMELLEGRTLHEVIRAGGGLPADRIVTVARQICGSLREAHALGLIHRDLKPANVVLLRHGDDDDFVKVLDFGLVKQTGTNDEFTSTDAVVGSPTFMSPEQIRSEPLDARSDIYSLGVILYTAVAGKPPFAAETSVGVLLAHIHQPPPPLDPALPALRATPALRWLIERCLEKAPGDRFADTDELIRGLRHCEAELRGELLPLPVLKDGRLLREPGTARASGSGPVPGLRAPAERPELRSEPSIRRAVGRRPAVPRWALAIVGLGGLMGLFGILAVVGVLVWPWTAPVVSPAPAPAVSLPGVLLSVTPATAVLRHDGVVLLPGTVAIPRGETWEIAAEADGFVPARVRVPWNAERAQIDLVATPQAPIPSRTGKSARRGVAEGEERVQSDPAPAEPSNTAAPPRSQDLKDPWAP